MATDMTTKTWDYAAYAAIRYDGLRHEIVDGEHFMNPAPNLYHQQVSRRIQFQLYSVIELPELGVVINAPVDVQLSDRDIVQPDLVIVLKGNRHILTPTKVKGIPDLLVEILSPSNSEYDLKTKRQAYQQNGVGEYWIVFPDEHQVLQLLLRNGQYEEHYFTDSITTHIPPRVAVDLKKVW